MTIPFPSLCAICKHKFIDDNKGLVCKAYPNGIPRKYLENLELHFNSGAQDNEIVFEPLSDFNKEEVAGFIDSLKSLKTAFEYNNEDENETIRGVEFESNADNLPDIKELKKSITIIKTSVGTPKEIKPENKDKNNYSSRSFEAESKIEVEHLYRILQKRSGTKDNGRF